jgi:ABC-2 type transport system ATP-binding protein
LLGKLDIETFVLDLRQPITQPPVLEGAEIVLRDSTTLEASMPKSRSLNRLFRVLEEQGIEVTSMRNKANRLEELFVRLVNMDGEQAA